MELRQIVEYNEILNLIYDFSDVFPSITKDEQTAVSFAKKFFSFARVTVLVTDDKTIGMAIYYSNDSEKGYGYISLIGIKADYQGQKWGGYLLSYVIDDMKRNNMKYIRLECMDSNKKAYGFYCKMGFENEGRAGKDSFYMIKNI